jgi:hypothetical protein
MRLVRPAFSFTEEVRAEHALRIDILARGSLYRPRLLSPFGPMAPCGFRPRLQRRVRAGFSPDFPTALRVLYVAPIQPEPRHACQPPTPPPKSGAAAARLPLRLAYGADDSS